MSNRSNAWQWFSKYISSVSKYIFTGLFIVNCLIRQGFCYFSNSYYQTDSICNYNIAPVENAKGIILSRGYLARLTWLIHSSVLPSIWNLSKSFVLTGPLGQVHMVKKYFWNSSMRKPFSCNSFYLLALRKITISVIKMTIFQHGGISEIFILPYELD